MTFLRRPLSLRIAAVASTTAILFMLTGCDRKSETTQSASKTDETTQAAQSNRPTSMADIPDDQTRQGWSNQQKVFVRVVPEPNPIPFQELFELTVSVYDGPDAENPRTDLQLDQVRAVMPAHDHGMKVDPRITQKQPGVFRIQGMRWHMKGPGEDGHWKLELVFNTGSAIETAVFDYQCCRPSGGDGSPQAE